MAIPSVLLRPLSYPRHLRIGRSAVLIIYMGVLRLSVKILSDTFVRPNCRRAVL